MIELYIEGEKIDLREDITLDFIYETVDPDKLASIKNSFSKTVDIPGTGHNNLVFGHIFRMDKYIPIAGPSKIDSFYDPHKRVDWIINKNGALVNRGYCTLDSIDVNSKREISYKITLYGGLGEFFYSLSYNEDGSPKTLKDIFFDWRPKLAISGYGSAMNEAEESINTLMKCSADIVAQSWHNLNPLYTYSGTTDFDKDVVFVPCYSGLYEDFDSKHMLVSTFNQNYNTSPAVMTSAVKTKLSKVFPDAVDENGTPVGSSDPSAKYFTIGRTLSHTDSYRYGLVTFSRDLDPYEAGDLRVNELPVAIRLSKLMTAISNPANNGGYTVSWDTEITSSAYWIYSWILLGKIKQSFDTYMNLQIQTNETYDGQQFILETVSHEETSMSTVYDGVLLSSGTTDYTLASTSTSLAAGRYEMILNVLPKWEFEYRKSDNGWDYNVERYPFISGSMSLKSSSGGGQGHISINSGSFVWVTPILIHRIYDNGTLLNTVCDIFYYTSSSSWTFGLNPRMPASTVKSNTENWIQSNFGSTDPIDEFNWHDCIISNPQEAASTYGAYITCLMDSQKISTTIDLSSASTNLYVTQDQSIVYTKVSWVNSTPTVSIGTFNNSTPVSVWLLGFVRSNYNTYQTFDDLDKYFKYSFSLDTAKQNGFLTMQSSGFSIINLDKSTLFAKSSAPMKYLADFCKVMNYKFICDTSSKTIRILPLKKYYIDSAIDINDKVDLSRGINIKPVVTKYKRINLGLDTPETYPVSLFNKTNEDKFNTFKFDTQIEYNTSEQELLKSCIYKNTLDWQQSSVFYNIYPQFPRAYDTVTVSWTMFDDEHISLDELNSKEWFTSGAPAKVSNLLATIDFHPKPALFDNSNKEKEAYPSLLFLNGFVKNYDYTLTATDYNSPLTPSSKNESHYINSSGVVSTSSYQDIFIYNITDTTLTYKVTASFGSSYGSYTVNYYDSSNTRIGYEYAQASATLVNAVLTVPSGTASIRCNFRKADTDAKLSVENDLYTVSPKVSLSNDTIEQYYLAGGRCYMYDFKYNDNFTSWGCYSSDQKGSAASWVLPFFSKDLYNLYVPDINKWQSTPYIYASWNINNQSALSSTYSLYSTDFIKNPSYSYGKQLTSLPSSNEYSIGTFPVEDDSTRIYDNSWKDYMNDIYDRNTREVTLYVDLSMLNDPNDILRQTYLWRGCRWIITKMHNYRVANIYNDRFTKVTMNKIVNINAWT